MDGFTEDMKNRVGAALDKQAKSGQQSLMMVHLQKLQAKRDEEAAAQREIDEERELREQIDSREEKKRHKKEMKREKKKRKKEKEKKKKERKREKRRRDSSSSSGSDSEDDALKAARAAEEEKVRLLEQEKVEKEERRREKRRRREEEAEREAEEKQAAEDREKLRAWQESQLHEQRHTTSEQIISEPAPSETHAEPPVPLHYFSRHKSVAWQFPGPDGVVSFARRVDAGPAGNSADAAVSEDDW